MKIISWNTRGLGSTKTRRVVKDFLHLENPNVVMFQETKKRSMTEGLLVVSGRLGIRSRLLFRLVGLQEGF